MSEAVATMGTTLSVGGTPIAQVQDVSGPALSTDTDEITNHSSPDGVEEHIATIKRTGEVSFPLVFLPSLAGHAGLMTAWEDRSLDSYTLTYPDGSTWTFNAYVTGFGQSAPVGGHLSADVTLRVTGAPVFVPAGS